MAKNLHTDRLKTIFSEHLVYDKSLISENTTLIGDMGADSLDCVELLMSVECEFNITINDDEAETVKTFGDALKLVSTKTGEV